MGNCPCLAGRPRDDNFYDPAFPPTPRKGDQGFDWLDRIGRLPQSWYRDQQFFLALHRRELIFDLNRDDDIKHELHVKGVAKWLVEAVKQCDNGPSYTNTSGSRASGPTHTIAVPAKNIFYRPPPAAAKNHFYPADGSLFPFPGTPGSRAGELVFIAGLKNKPDFEGAQVLSLIRPEEFLVLRPPPTTIDGSRELRRNYAVPIDDMKKGGGVVTHDTGVPETSECMPRFRVMSLVAQQEEQKKKLAAFLKVRPVNAVLAETEQRLDAERRGGGSDADHHFQALDHEEVARLQIQLDNLESLDEDQRGRRRRLLRRLSEYLKETGGSMPIRHDAAGDPIAS